MEKTQLNTDMVDQFIEAFASEDDSLLIELIGLFQQVSQDELLKIQNYQKTQNWLDISKSAHKIKSSAGNLGVQDFYNLCLELEKNAKASNVEQTNLLISHMDQTYKNSLKELQTYLKSKGHLTNSI